MPTSDWHVMLCALRGAVSRLSVGGRRCADGRIDGMGQSEIFVQPKREAPLPSVPQSRAVVLLAIQGPSLEGDITRCGFGHLQGVDSMAGGPERGDRRAWGTGDGVRPWLRSAAAWQGCGFRSIDSSHLDD
ncbi:hypothetical protein [Streptomyces sp. BRA346]|uniref:hypothetical protein n=1 Tax=Streptomyces sp. BRA346 TaxID=2878199 RepID=UPI0040642663